MDAFGLELGPSDLRTLAAVAEARYPREACGVGLAVEGAPAPVRWRELRNVSSAPRRGFRFDDAEQLATWRAAVDGGEAVRVVFHSHGDAPAELSATDRAALVVGGIELFPGVVHVVISVYAGRCEDIAAHRYAPASGAFEAVRLGPPPSTAHGVPSGPCFA